ncbi:MAG: hypothetical protein U9Q98_09775 [Bacteroidota bacterium]|nr:hypothetical protein [Bacteroidota bacterium]
MKPRGHLIISLYAQNMDVDDYVMTMCRNYGFELLFKDKITGISRSRYNTVVDHGYILRFVRK